MNKKTIALCLTLTAAASSFATNGNDPFFDWGNSFMKIHEELEKMSIQMNKVFDQMTSNFRTQHFGNRFNMTMPKDTIQLKEEDDKTILNVKVGKDVTSFDAKIRTKKEGYKKDQLIIKMKEPKNQRIAIKVNGKTLSIYQKVEKIQKEISEQKIEQSKDNQKTDKDVEKKTEEKNKIEAVSYGAHASSFSTIVKNRLDLKKADIEYDEKEGTLKITVPTLQDIEEKKIPVKRKK